MLIVVLIIISLLIMLSLFIGIQMYLYPTGYLFLLLFPLIFVVVFIIYMIILSIFSLFINTKKDIKKFNKFYYWFIKETIPLLIFFSNTKVHLLNENLLPNSRFLLVSNHISNFDPIVLIHKIKAQPLVCITKPQNLKIPVAGPFIKRCGFIPIDRDNAFNALKSINLAAKYLQDNVSNIYICPEGTRSKTGELLPFHAGSFKIAYKANVPIVIASIKNTRKIAKNFPFKRTHVYIKILKIIQLDEMEKLSTNEIAEMTRKLIEEDLKEK